MSDSIKHVWITPGDPNDMAPLPAIQYGDDLFRDYDRRTGAFSESTYTHPFIATFDTFEECRAAMIELRTQWLKESRENSRQLAASIEHIRSLPHAKFPDVIREVREAPQEEAQGQEEAKAEETVTPQPEAEPAKGEAKPALKRPSRSKP